MRTLKSANSYLVSLASIVLLMLALTVFPSCASSAASPENVTIGLLAKDFAFNTSTITVPAGANVTVNFDNQDASIGHNLAVYDSASMKKTIFKGEIKENNLYLQCPPRAWNISFPMRPPCPEDEGRVHC
jgi:plastocyanin